MPEHKVFAAAYNAIFAGLEKGGLADKRRELLAQARGATLELGAGTGHNLPHYPAAVERLVLTEPDPHMAKRLRAQLAESGRSGAEVVEAGAEALPFGDDEFDTVVATLVFCTIPDPRAALDEVARVLRPGGRMLFLEHVRAHSPRRARWQDRLNPVQNLLFGGCNLNRPTAATLEASPLEVEELRDDRMPRVGGPLVEPMIVGSARVA
ncbi:MAG TPA: class I SAM-dependent methyltransferase [Thermoleophilaceae bacterium]|jgi:SAM-dependent methyltransferase